jgi:hypothetical protein
MKEASSNSAPAGDGLATAWLLISVRIVAFSSCTILSMSKAKGSWPKLTLSASPVFFMPTVG